MWPGKCLLRRWWRLLFSRSIFVSGFPRFHKRYQCEGDHCQRILGVPGRLAHKIITGQSRKSSLSRTSLDLRAWLPSEPQLGSWSSLGTPSSTSLVACRTSGSASCPSSSTGSSPSIRTFKTTRRWVFIYPLYDTCTGGTGKVGAFLGRRLWWRENDLINHWGTTTIWAPTSTETVAQLPEID